MSISNPGQILHWLGGPIDVHVEIDTGLAGATFGIWDTGTWEVSTWGSEDPEWTDISEFVEGVQITQGRERWGQRFEAGSCTIILNDTDGRFTPESGVNPFHLPFRPGRRVRVVAIPDTTTGVKVPIFTGSIDSSFDSYDEAGFNLTTTINCIDYMGTWANHDPPALITPTGVESTDERVISALDRMGWPDDAEHRDIQTGVHSMQSSHLAQSTLEECARAADAEGGDFFCSKDGKAVFKARDWLTTDERSILVQGYLGYDSYVHFEDDFTGTVIDPLKWNNLNTDDDAFASEITQNDALFIEHTGAYQGVESDEQFNLAHTRITFQMSLGEATSTSFYECAFFSDAFWVGLFHDLDGVDEKTIVLGNFLSGHELTYDPDVHKWFRIDFTDTQATYYWSTDGITWTEEFTDTFDPSDVGTLVFDAGEGGVTTVTTPASLDDLLIEQIGNQAHVVSVEPSWELARVINQVRFARVGSTMQEVEDESSQANFDIRDYERTDFQNNTDAEVLFLAERYLAQFKDSRPRLDRITINGVDDPDNKDLNRLFWDSELGDLLQVNVAPAWGWNYERQVQVMGMHHDITPEDWTLTFMLDDALTGIDVARDFMVDLLNPLAWWKFAEVGGTSTADASGNGHTLTWSGTPTLTGTGGPNGTGLVTLDGTDDFATVASEAALELRQDMTIEFWFRPHDIAGTYQGVLTCRATNDPLYEVSYRPDGYVFLFPTSAAGAGVAMAGLVPANTWTHVVIVIDWSDTTRTLRFYKNGAALAENEYSYLPAAAARVINIGRRAVANDQYFDGDLAEMVIYNRILTPQQIQNLYNSMY